MSKTTRRLSLNDRHRHEPDHLAGDACSTDHLHHFVHVLVSLRGLFGETGHTPGPHADAAVFEFLTKRLPANRLLGLSPAHGAARAVTCAAERLGHAAGSSR